MSLEAGPDIAAEVVAQAPRAKRPQMFTRRAAKIPMPADAAARQGRIAMLAWETLGDGEAVRTFLNTHDDALGARPIDLATGSEAGLTTVAATLAALGERAA